MEQTRPCSSNKKSSLSNLGRGKVELKKRSKVRHTDGNVDARTYHLIPGPIKKWGNRQMGIATNERPRIRINFPSSTN